MTDRFRWSPQVPAPRDAARELPAAELPPVELPTAVAAALSELETSGAPAVASVDRVMRAVRARPVPVRPSAAAMPGLAAGASPVVSTRDGGRRRSRAWRTGWWRVGVVAASVAGAVGVAGRVRVEGAADRGAHVQPQAQAAEARAADGAAVLAAGGVRPAQFLVLAPGARRVAIVGDFNGWSAAATPMRRDAATGAWTARVVLPAGRYVYAYVVDGTRWMADPNAPLAPADGFGRQSSVLVLGAQYAAR